MYKKLQELRNEKGISAIKMAEIIGLSTETGYYKKEQGNIRFSLQEAKQISDYLGYPIEKIFFEEDLSKMENLMDEVG